MIWVVLAGLALVVTKLVATLAAFDNPDTGARRACRSERRRLSRNRADLSRALPSNRVIDIRSVR